MRVFIEFARAEDAARALRTLKSLGYLDIETYAPFPIADEDAHASRGSFGLGVLAFGAGVAALAAAYLVQWYANVGSYALNIGGRPAHAGPAFVPATFESICLAATAAVLVGFLVFERLPRWWQPIFEIDGFERASVDRFWIVLSSRPTLTDDRIARDVVPLGPLRIIVGEDGL